MLCKDLVTTHCQILRIGTIDGSSSTLLLLSTKTILMNCKLYILLSPLESAQLLIYVDFLEFDNIIGEYWGWHTYNLPR